MTITEHGATVLHALENMEAHHLTATGQDTAPAGAVNLAAGRGQLPCRPGAVPITSVVSGQAWC